MARGAIPDENEGYSNWRAEEANYTTSSPDADVRARAGDSPEFIRRMESSEVPRIAMGDPRRDRTVQVVEAEAPPPAAPRARDVRAAARGAVDMGVRGLQRFFGLERSGAMPSDDDEMIHSAGAERLRRGEGAATSEEIAAIDTVTGIDQMQFSDEGVKNLARLDRAVNWYLERGQQDKAEAVAMSLLQHGATKVRQAGMMAAAALSEYQESGDPQDMQHAIGYMKLAHQLIPDGFNIDIGVDPKTRQLVVTAVDDDGQEQKHVVSPQAIPALLQKALDGSAYWESMFRIGHPSLANTRESHRLSAETSGANAEAAAARSAAEWDRRHGITREETLQDKEREAQIEQFKHDRGLSEGLTDKERARIANDAFYADWGQQRQQDPNNRELMEAGLAHTFENTPERNDPVSDEELVGRAQELQEQYGEDLPALTNIARAIAVKNEEYDGVGSTNVASALISEPGLSVAPDGTLSVAGLNIVFNPTLLPQLWSLRKKYVPPTQ